MKHSRGRDKDYSEGTPSILRHQLSINSASRAAPFTQLFLPIVKSNPSTMTALEPLAYPDPLTIRRARRLGPRLTFQPRRAECLRTTRAFGTK